MKPSIGTVDVVACPHPFTMERVTVELPAGPSLADFVSVCGVRDGMPAHVWVQDVYIPRERWHRAYPKAGASIVIRAVPAGGGEGKDVGRTLAMIAVVALAAWAGPAGAAFMGMGQVGGAVLTAAVGIAGSLAVNALIPPPQPKVNPVSGLSMDRQKSITGTRNQLLPYGVIPKIYGRHRIYPPLGALPFTESEGDKQFFRMLFIPGYGPLSISDMRIGETPLEQYQGVEYEVREGYDTDEPVTLFTDDVFEESLSVNLAQSGSYAWTRTFFTTEWSAATTYAAGDIVGDPSHSMITGWVSLSDGNLNNDPATSPAHWVYVYRPGAINPTETAWISRTTQAAAKEISLELTAPGGLVYLRRGSYKGWVDIGLVVEYAVAGSGSWSRPTFTGISGSGSNPSAGVVIMTGADGGTVRLGLRWPAGGGQYDVRVRRVFTAVGLDDKDTISNDQAVDELYWSTLRTVGEIDPVQMVGLCQIALRIQATDQLNGVLDQFSCVAQALLPTYDGADWTEPVATSNPAWAYVDTFCGPGNMRALPYTSMNVANLKSWADWCTANNIEYNAVIDARSTVFQMARDIAAVGFAAFSRQDGTYGVVRDIAQTSPVRYLTPRNSWGFKGTKTFYEIPHVLRVRFLNPDKGWQQDEVLVFDDGYTAETATNIEVLELFGVTSALQAWKRGRFDLAQIRLRPETYELWMDFESIVFTRGDMVRCGHDVALWSQGWGRIKSIDGQTVTLDERILIESGTVYAFNIHIEATGSELYVEGGYVDDGYSSGGIGAGSEVSGTIGPMSAGEYSTFTVVGDLTGAVVGDLVIVGQLADLIVKAIEPGPDFTARILLVDAAPGIHQAWTGDIPAFDSQITLPVVREQLPPPTPTIDNIVSDESVLIRTATGIASQIVLSYSVTSASSIPVSMVECQYRQSGLNQSWKPLPASPHKSGSFAASDVVDGQSYDLRIRSVSPWGVASSWVETSHTVAGKSGLPADVTGLSLQLSGGRVSLTWNAHPDLDVIVGGVILVKHTRKTSGAAWNDGLDIGGQIAGSATSANLPAISGTYMVRAMDSGGRLSENFASVITTAPSLINYNVVETLDDAPTFSGTKTDVEVNSSALRLTETDGLAALTGNYVFADTLDLGGVFVSRVWGAVQSEGYEVSDQIGSRGMISLWPSIVGAVVDDVTAVIEVRTTEDDPAGTPTWTGWAPVIGTEMSFRALQARLVMTTPDPNHNALVSVCSVTVDMPDRVASARNVSLSSGGENITFSPAFKAIPSIGYSVQNSQSGDFVVVTNQAATGFTVQVKNGAAGVARVIDWQAAGYGYAG